MTDRELDYRNLVNCRVEITMHGSSGSSQPPVNLPQECYNAANVAMPTLYDFALGMFQRYVVGTMGLKIQHSTDNHAKSLAHSFFSFQLSTTLSVMWYGHNNIEKSILKKKDEATTDREMKHTGGSSSREELQRSLLFKMKSVTNANENVCVSILENNNYDLKTSIETYFQSSI